MKYLAVLLAVFCVVSVAEADPIRVSQESSAGAGDFDANVLGFVNVFNTALNIGPYYKYNIGDGSSYNGDDNGGPAPISSTSQLFLVDAANGLSLVILHDNVNDGSGGEADTQFNLSGDTASIGVRDDNESGYTDNGTQFSAEHNWIDCCTDGYTIGALDGDWTMLGQFTATPTGITSWQVTSNGGASIALVLDTARRVRLDVVPEPASAALLGVAFAGIYVVRRRRR